MAGAFRCPAGAARAPRSVSRVCSGGNRRHQSAALCHRRHCFQVFTDGCLLCPLTLNHSSRDAACRVAALARPAGVVHRCGSALAIYGQHRVATQVHAFDHARRRFETQAKAAGRVFSFRRHIPAAPQAPERTSDTGCMRSKNTESCSAALPMNKDVREGSCSACAAAAKGKARPAPAVRLCSAAGAGMLSHEIAWETNSF